MNVTPAMVRDGMEALNITEELMAARGMPGFGPAFQVSCANHGGSGIAKIQQWDATTKKWSLVTDWISADRSIIDPLIAEDSEAFAKENNITERACN